MAKLEVWLEDLEKTCARLRAASDAYQRIRGMVVSPPATTLDPNSLPLQIILRDTGAHVDLAALPAAGNVELLQDFQAQLGEAVVNGWAEAHRITQEASQHCAALASAASGTPPAAPTT